MVVAVVAAAAAAAAAAVVLAGAFAVDAGGAEANEEVRFVLADNDTQ